jgi:plastocyanin
LRTNRTLTAGAVLTFAAVLGAHAQQPISGHVELTRNGHPLKNASEAVVWLTPVGAKVDAPHQNPNEVPKLVQKDKSFHPDLLVIPVGGKVEFPNRDPFFHNVFSMFEGKRFDLGLYESGTTRFVQFDKPGISFIFCNIHAQMSAVIITLATPYYGITDPRGQVTINDVPAGRYELQIFHAAVPPDALRALTREVTIAPGQNTLGNFTLAETDALVAHKNKYGHDYDRPDPDSPAYTRP